MPAMADALANAPDSGSQSVSEEAFANEGMIPALQEPALPSATEISAAEVASDADERRRHPRAPVDLLVGLKFDSVQQFLAVYAEDISESGMFLRSEHAGAVREVG